jgi:hypothetical protein
LAAGGAEEAGAAADRGATEPLPTGALAGVAGSFTEAPPAAGAGAELAARTAVEAGEPALGGPAAFGAATAGAALDVRVARVGVVFPATPPAGVVADAIVGAGTAACTRPVCKPRPKTAVRAATSACMA